MLHRSSTWIALLLVAACRPATPPSPPPAAQPAAVRQVAAPEAVVIEPPPVAAHVAAVNPPWALADIPRIVAVQALVHDAARRHGVDADVMNAIIWHESKFHAKARGPGGAAGLMQLMPTTSKSLAKRLGRTHRPYDAEFNVDAGALLLSRLLVIFDGDLRLALAGYGLGHAAVKRRLAAGEPLPEKTERFVAKVERWSVAFATLPCPGGRARDAAGDCAATAGAGASPTTSSAK